MPSTEVYILGQKYSVSGDAPREHIEELARYIDGKLKEITKAAPNTSPVKALILTALDITDELYKLRAKKGEDISSEVESRVSHLSAMLEEVLSPREQ